MEITTSLPIASGEFCLSPIDGLILGFFFIIAIQEYLPRVISFIWAFPSHFLIPFNARGNPITFRHFQVAFLYPFIVAKRLSIAFQSISQQLTTKMGQFLQFIWSTEFLPKIRKNRRCIDNFWKLSVAPLLIIFYHIIPLLARLKLVPQFL